jgi:alanyl-tRNA synthetase
VAPGGLRFDFTHTQPMSDEEVAAVEDIVNRHILADEPVAVGEDVPIAEARARGAMALFGEKYGDRVRVVEIPGYSVELCGGTHLERTSQAGLLKIMSETGIAAGVRRIEARTGPAVYAWMREAEEQLDALARTLRASRRDVLAAAEKVVAQRSALEKQVQQLKAGAVNDGADLQVTDIGGVSLVHGIVPGADADMLVAQAERAAKEHDGVVVLGSAVDGKVIFVARVMPGPVARGLHAGNIVREVAKAAGGGGGGRPDFAQAGGRDPSRLDEAIGKVEGIVRAQVR